ncbi:MAG: hypothetical protein IPP19_02775 [Verrucomicrobia bacterium]|nr:hypothetical protein [Verrucomicrobiota bacterium]
MLRELIDALRTKCAPGARALGLAYEAAAIAARHRRVGKSWAPHIAASHQVILRGAARCRKHERVLVIGAGACFDVPVAELAAQFSEVILADVAVSAVARRWQRRLPGRVRAIAWDATGVLASLAEGRRTLTANAAVELFAGSDPGVPPGGDADLVVSANCLSQLGLIPADQLVAAEADDELPARCAIAAARRHIAWLAARPGVRVLISDVTRLDIAPDGRELARRTIFKGLELRAPDQSWRWDLAPIPEWSREWHRVHEVSAWIDEPA